MTDGITKDLSDSDQLNLILSRLTAIETDGREMKTRLTAIEEDRARDTRPLLGEIRREMQDGFARLEEEGKSTRREIRMLREDARNERLARAVVSRADRRP